MSSTFTKESQNHIDIENQAMRESSARSYPYRIPISIREANGMLVKDADNRSYLDCLAGAGTLALGHNHPVPIEAMKRTLEEGSPIHTLDFTTPIKEQFIDEIFESLPSEFAKRAKIHFCGPTGADAVEAALKLVKTATGNRSILSFQGGYHGSTHGAMSISGNINPKKHVQGFTSDTHFLPYPYAYRSSFGIGEEGHKGNSQYIENLLDDPEGGISPPAGLIMEIVQGESGSIPAPNEWVREMRRMTKDRNIPLIVDEVQTGLGRTGKLFAFEHAGITPDVLILSKVIGGSLPLSVVIYDRQLDQWGPGAHIGTFRGNQLAMAAGTATLQYIKEKDFPGHAQMVGARMMDQLSDIKRESAFIGDIRGRGLMIGVEIVNTYSESNKQGAYPVFPELASRIQQECLQRGLIIEVGGRFDSTMRFLPPLIITEQQVDDVCSIFREAIIAAESAIRSNV